MSSFVTQLKRKCDSCALCMSRLQDNCAGQRNVKTTGQLCRTKECQDYRATVQDKGMSKLQGNSAGQRNVKTTGQLCRTKECQDYRATVQDKGMSRLQRNCAGQRNVKTTGQLCRTKECQDYRATVQDKGMTATDMGSMTITPPVPFSNTFHQSTVLME